MKLFTIGDSLSQGFMSLAGARTDLAYSTLIARCLNLQPQGNYQYPEWPAGGFPANLERILRQLYKRYRSDISGLEWLTVLQTINDVIDEAEDYYERGPGSADRPYPGQSPFFNNIAISGFNVADAWLVTPALCQAQIRQAEQSIISDGFLTGPSAPFYRNALKVLNPSLSSQFMDYSQLRWLEHHAAQEGVETVILWLGSMQALKTVVTLKIRQTPNDPARRPASLTHLERETAEWNLWHPDDFEDEYRQLLERTSAALHGNRHPSCHVFLGTIPFVTIAPLAKGVGPCTQIGDRGWYYKYYTYFPFEEEFARTTGLQLTMAEALHIDDCIREYNARIRKMADELNANQAWPQYHVVDICEALRQAAWKRNGGWPTYIYPDYFRFSYPKVDTKFYHADAQGRLRQGGLFSLDGVHPSAIGQGLVAWEFMKVMGQTGVLFTSELNWPEIFASDSLYTNPIPIMPELYQHEELAKHVVKLIQGCETFVP